MSSVNSQTLLLKAEPEKAVLDDLIEDSSSINLLDFTLEAGVWSQGTGHRRRAHTDLLLSLPLLRSLRRDDCVQVDAIIVPEMEECILDSFLSLAYSGM